jgi:hypothetical protein
VALHRDRGNNLCCFAPKHILNPVIWTRIAVCVGFFNANGVKTTEEVVVRDDVVPNNTSGFWRVLSAAEPDASLTAEALSVLPEDLCGDLENALILLDVDRVTALIRRVAENYPAVGSILSTLSENLAYTSMLRAIVARKFALAGGRP